MLELIAIVVAGAAGIGGYVKTRQFVRERLRFVDAARNRTAPFLAGAAAMLAAAPVVWLLPVVGGGTALLLGVGVGVGVHRGARDIARLQLPPL
ncbi:MAG TPA: hypothetical protein VJ957_08800 [Longimicrobiales bacterium]|nr:hypothetical protein [Longimicrobiales bacterium]